MKLKDVEHYDDFFKRTIKFSFGNNRFYLFDKYGRELNEYAMEKVPDVLELNVLETRESSYSGWNIGFKTTHIRLDFENLNKTKSRGIRFGMKDTRL